MGFKINPRKYILISKKSNGKCWYCGKNVEDISDDTPVGDTPSVDHVNPFSESRDDVKNLVLSCRSCNSSKNNKDIETYRFGCARKKLGIPLLSREIISYLKYVGPIRWEDIIEVYKKHIFYGETL